MLLEESVKRLRAAQRGTKAGTGSIVAGSGKVYRELGQTLEMRREHMKEHWKMILGNVQTDRNTKSYLT